MRGVGEAHTMARLVNLCVVKTEGERERMRRKREVVRLVISGKEITERWRERLCCAVVLTIVTEPSRTNPAVLSVCLWVVGRTPAS